MLYHIPVHYWMIEKNNLQFYSLFNWSRYLRHDLFFFLTYTFNLGIKSGGSLLCHIRFSHFWPAGFAMNSYIKLSYAKVNGLLYNPQTLTGLFIILMVVLGSVSYMVSNKSSVFLYIALKMKDNPITLLCNNHLKYNRALMIDLL